MKRFCISLLLLVVALSVRARDYAVRRLPDAQTEVSEVSTNVAFNVHRSDVRTFALRLEIDPVASNAVQVAFGRDVNADGNLSAEETDLIVGMDDDRAFIEDVERDERAEKLVVASDGTRRFLEMTVSTDSVLKPRSIAFTNESGACFSDASTGGADWSFSSDWNLFKVTRRGANASCETVRIHAEYNYMSIILR